MAATALRGRDIRHKRQEVQPTLDQIEFAKLLGVNPGTVVDLEKERIRDVDLISRADDLLDQVKTGQVQRQ